MRTPTPHPIITLPGDDWFREVLALPDGEERVSTMLEEREKRIRLMKEYPLKYGYDTPFWGEIQELWKENDEVCVLGGNRGGKSEFAAKWVVELLMSKPGAIVACFHSTQQSSINQQQEYIYRYLPPEWRRLKRLPGDNVTNISYTKANGFTNQKLILPNGSMCLFFYYAQDPDVLEGYELDGAWMDELAPLAFVKTVRYRLITRNGRMLVTFTPKNGYTPTVAEYVAGATPVKTERAELLAGDKVHVKGCPPGHMPRVLKCRHSRRAVACIFSKDNVFNDYDRLKSELENEPDSVVKIRAYGWAEKATAGVLTHFNEGVHVISRERWKRIEAGGGLRVVSADPSYGGKPWFVKWYFITPQDHVILYREWPGRQQFGWWAEPSDRAWKWKPGEAWKAEANLSMNRLKELCWQLEGQAWDDARGAWDEAAAEKIFERCMDPRFGGHASPGSDEGVTIISLLNESERDEQGRLKWPGMDWVEAPSSRIEDTVTMINNRLAFNEDLPITPLNTPSWFVVEGCEQTILAYKEYSTDEYGGYSQKCALKDIIDPDRYFIKSDYRYFEPGDLKPRGGGNW